MAVFIVRTERRPGIIRFVVRWQQTSLHRQVHLGSFKTKTEAELRKQWAERELAAGRVPDRTVIGGATHRRLVRDVVAEWLETRRADMRPASLESITDRTRPVVDLLGHLDASEVSPRDVQTMILSLKDRGEANRTIRGRISILRMVLDYAGIDPNPVDARSVKKPPSTGKRVTIPTPDEEDLILSRLNAEHRAIVEFIGATGLRISEAVNLTWADVDADHEAIRIVESKTAAGERWVQSEPDAPFALPDRPEGAADWQRVFPVASRGAVGQGILRACRGKQHEEATRTFGPHSWRHLHASRCLRNGMDVVRVAARLGHSNPQITLRVYAHLIVPRR
jgi:integrase